MEQAKLNLVKEKEDRRAEPGFVEMLVQEIKGRRVVLYGPSWAGKTTLVLHLAPHLGKVLFIDTDRNYPVEETAKKLRADLIYRQARSFYQAFYFMRGTQADTVIVDSLSGLIGSLIEEEGAGSPRIALLSAQLQDQLIRLCKNFNTSIIVTHVGADFRRGGERVRINQSLLRYIDVLLKVDSDSEGKRHVYVQKREVVESPSFTVAKA